MRGNLIWRKSVNAVMLSVTGVFTVLAVSSLFLILGYLVYYGGRSLDWNFFTKLPLPPGEIGGGILECVKASTTLLLRPCRNRARARQEAFAPRRDSPWRGDFHQRQELQERCVAHLGKRELLGHQIGLAG